MRIIETGIEGLFLVEPEIVEDFRGFSYEVFRESILFGFNTKNEYAQLSHKTVARGPHYQPSCDNNKIITVNSGSAIVIATDLRQSSKTYKKTYGTILSNVNRSMLFVPVGMASGSYATTDTAEITIRCDKEINMEEAGIFWDKNVFDLGDMPMAKSSTDLKWPTIGQI